jgi:hypothetical protein
LSGEKEAFMKAVQEKIKQALKGVCKHCKQSRGTNERGLWSECENSLSESRKERMANKKAKNDKGYIYVYNDEGQMVLEHRKVMADLLGRPLRKHEVVLHRDLDKSNNSPENLMLGFRNGIPLEHLQCNTFSTVGDFSLSVFEPQVPLDEMPLPNPGSQIEFDLKSYPSGQTLNLFYAPKNTDEVLD